MPKKFPKSGPNMEKSASGRQMEKYGLWWREEAHPLNIELTMINRGGEWTKADGGKAGKGNLFHYKEAIRIIWPEIKQHRWFDLFLENWLTHKYVAVLGPKSSGKTLCAAVFHLVDYYCFPSCTTILICSTTKERLEDRIWGDVKKLHGQALRQFRWLPGHLIEGRQRLVTDDRDDDDEAGRDFRNGFAGLPCFPSGTLVDTPYGPTPIENIRVGDLVLSAIGFMPVTQTHRNPANRLIRLHLSSGAVIDCTPNHRFLTPMGWITSGCLNQGNQILTAYEALRILRQGIHAQRPERPILFKELLGEVDLANAGDVGTDFGQERFASDCASDKGWPFSQSFESGEDVGVEKIASRLNCLSPHEEKLEAAPFSRRQGIWQPRQRAWAYPSGVCFIGAVPRGETRACNFDWYGSEKLCFQNRNAALLQARFGVVGHKTRGRGGWRRTSATQAQLCGFEKDNNSEIIRVDRVEILERGSDCRYNESSGGYTVFNLSVAGHPSYSVAGCLSHNCKTGSQYVGISSFQGIKNKRVRLCADEMSALPKTVIDAIATLDCQGDTKVTGMGNPAQTTDSLGVLAEPHVSIGGWEGGIDQTPKTKTWKTRFEGGICIQLPGSDCPNMDAEPSEPVPFPFLITRKQMEDDLKTWGKDDWHYTMFNEGRMPRGQGSRRIITRQLCLKHKALEAPIWKNSNRIKITALDAAYRAVGGDRCVFLELDFGEEAESEIGDMAASAIINQVYPSREKRQIMALIDVLIIPIKSSDFESPEDQIVMFVKKEHEQRNIPPENHFFDAGMRTSLVSAYSRNWSPMVNPIDFGGKPSERQVSSDIDVSCRDYYSKFVTELWWSVRLVIEAEQFRGMTEDMMLEGCAREWMTVAGNKIEAEPKDEMKLKTGRSPDLFDCLACGVEGARQRGFKIQRLSNKETKEEDHRWKQEVREKARECWKSGALNHKP